MCATLTENSLNRIRCVRRVYSNLDFGALPRCTRVSLQFVRVRKRAHNLHNLRDTQSVRLGCRRRAHTHALSLSFRFANCEWGNSEIGTTKWKLNFQLFVFVRMILRNGEDRRKIKKKNSTRRNRCVAYDACSKDKFKMPPY